jgi:hypothetical protein
VPSFVPFAGSDDSVFMLCMYLLYTTPGAILRLYPFILR